jgi:hypothetical protein
MIVEDYSNRSLCIILIQDGTYIIWMQIAAVAKQFIDLSTCAHMHVVVTVPYQNVSDVICAMQKSCGYIAKVDIMAWFKTTPTKAQAGRSGPSSISNVEWLVHAYVDKPLPGATKHHKPAVRTEHFACYDDTRTPHLSTNQRQSLRTTGFEAHGLSAHFKMKIDNDWQTVNKSEKPATFAEQLVRGCFEAHDAVRFVYSCLCNTCSSCSL